MQILLPVAGLGTRVRPHTHVRPKPMLSLAGKPVLGHLMDYLMQLNPSSFIVIVGERGEMVERYVRERYSVPAYFRTQTELKGQSHAIKTAADLITEPVLIVFGDSLFEAPLDRLVDSTVDGSLGVKSVADPTRFGIVELKDGFVSKLVEKPDHPQTNLATMGVYMLNDHRGLLQAIDEQIAVEDALKGEFFLAGALQRMIDRGARFHAVTATEWWDTGTIEAVLTAHRHLVERHRNRPAYNPVATIVEPCYIDPTAKLERCVIGPYVTVGPHTVIVDSVVSDSIIGEHVRLTGQSMKRSIIGDYAELLRSPISYNVSDHSTIGTVDPLEHGAHGG
jgi:glucose-1-phosphate thymidylyltransferase